jgi:hypothetical protein
MVQKIYAYFHLDIMIQHTTPAQRTGSWDFGVQHQLILIWNGNHMDTVMTCVHLKVCFILYIAFKIANQESTSFFQGMRQTKKHHVLQLVVKSQIRLAFSHSYTMG